MSPSGYIIWNLDTKSIAPGGVFKTSADATQGIRDAVAHSGNSPDKHDYAIVTVPVERL